MVSKPSSTNSTRTGNYSNENFQKFSIIEKTPHPISNNIGKSIEEILLDTGKWALFAIRIPGYFPMTIEKRVSGSCRLELKFWALPTFYTFFITILSVLWSGYFLKVFGDTFVWNESNQGQKDNTLVIGWTTMILLVTYTTYLRCSRIFFLKSSLTFWRRTVSMIEGVVKNGYSLKDHYLQKIHNNILIFTLLYHLTSLTRVIYSVYSIYIFSKDPCSNALSVTASILELFLTITLCYHVGYSLWLTFLISIFTMSFQLIHDDLDSIPTFINDHGFIDESTQIDTVDQFDHLKVKYVNISVLESERVNYQHDEISSPQDSRLLEYRISKTVATYELIEDHMHAFNSQFGVTLILETFFIFVYIVMSVYCLESFLQNDVLYAVFQIIPAGIYSSALYQLASRASILSGKATASLKKLEKFFVPSERPQLQMLQLKVLSLIARVADNPPTISAAHFFTMDRHLLTSFVSTVTTYLVVLLQFRSPLPPPDPPMSCLSNLTSSTEESLLESSMSNFSITENPLG